MKLKIVTYNIMSAREYKNIKNIDPMLAAAALKRLSPDIIGLNEVHGAGGAFSAQTVEICKELGYDYCYFCPALFLNGSYYGNALISRYPIISAEKIEIEDPLVKDEDTYYETRCIIKAKIDVGKIITVYVTHFGLAVSERKNAIRTFIDNFDGDTALLMGDLNLFPSDPMLDPIRDIMEDTAKASASEVLTFPSDVPDRKIDYIFTTSNIKTLSAGAIDVVTSDHRPYYAEIEI